jgi:hypothetical protein
MSDDIRISCASDYAVLEVGDLYFYYGYEHVWCKDHEQFVDRCGDDCDTEWAFTVKNRVKYIHKFRQSAEHDAFNVEEQLICGLAKFIAVTRPS